MKEWTIQEFVAECEELARNEYSYDYCRMPKGVCNGHTVGAYQNQFSSITIDGGVINLGVINDKWPDGSVWFVVGNKNMNCLEYVRSLLEAPVSEPKTDPTVYGYFNGEATYSRDEYVFKCRGFGAIQTDEELLAFAEKVTSNWFDAGWHRTFETYYLGDYALSEPYRSLTKREFERLLELQKEAQEAAKAADDARGWRLVERVCYADNSEEEIWEDKNGVRKNVTVVGPHGDAC